MAAEVDARTLKGWLSDGAEIALLDVREHGQYGEGHPFFAVPLPYSRFELGLSDLVPNPRARLVLCDGGDGIAARAATRAEALGYRGVRILAGGADAWRQAGYTLYAGVNVPSKTFGELVEQRRHTPRVTASQLQAMREAGEDLVIVDGRPFSEYRNMNIPGGICCPNGELAWRIKDIAPDPRTTVVVNCAGRTRSIIGAQTLIDFGVPNPVVALENGTQGWFLAGLEVEKGASRRYPDAMPRGAGVLAAHARSLAGQHGVAWVAPHTAHGWLADPARTTYLFDVRTPEEFAADGVSGFVHAPGGQLIQATDQWVGVKRARARMDPVSAARAGGADRDRVGRRGADDRPGHGARDRPAARDGLSQGPHRAGGLVDPPARRRGGGHGRDARAGRGRPRHRDAGSARSRRGRAPGHPPARRRLCGVGGREPADRDLAEDSLRRRLHRLPVLHRAPPRGRPRRGAQVSRVGAGAPGAARRSGARGVLLAHAGRLIRCIGAPSRAGA